VMAALGVQCEGILRKRDALNRWISRYVIFRIDPGLCCPPCLMLFKNFVQSIDGGPTEGNHVLSCSLCHFSR
jgi:hypothetical protein